MFARNSVILAGGLAAVLALVGPARAAFDYDEAISGDLSDDGLAPTLLLPGLGDNYLAGAVGAWGTDDDFFGFTVPPGLRLDALILVYHSSTEDTSYLAIEDDAVFVTGLGNPFYFGYCYFDATLIGTDLLPILGASNGNFEPPLGPGDYSFWVDEGGSTKGFSFLFQFQALGDLNCDGVANAFDIDGFVLAMTSAPSFAAYLVVYPDCDPTLADVNMDGAVNGFDIDAFIDLITGQ